MYSQWLDNESQDLQLNQEQLLKLKAQFKDVQKKITDHSESLNLKETSLNEQEQRLSVTTTLVSIVLTTTKAYQFKIQQKQSYIDELANLLKAQNKTVPVGTNIDEPVGELTWEDEVCPAFLCLFLLLCFDFLPLCSWWGLVLFLLSILLNSHQQPFCIPSPRRISYRLG